MGLIIGVVATIIAVIIIAVIIVKVACKDNEKSKKSHGCLITTIIILIIIGAAIGITVFIKNKKNPENTDNPGLLSRKATLNDITVTNDEFDITSLGERLTFTPKTDIEGLKLKFVFQKSNGTSLQTIEKSVGDVIKGKQYSVTISLTELEWSVIMNAFDLECRYTVSAGTVSYFAS